MHLTPHEIEKLMLHNAGHLAQKRLARGLKLNYPETVALIATQILEFIRDGRSVAELMDLGRQLLGTNQVMPGIPEMLHEVQIEGTFPDGSKLVTIHHPIAAENGNLALALHGSFLPIPDLALFAQTPTTPIVPGELLTAPGDIEANINRRTVQLSVTNLGDRPIQVGSHYHFTETNASLKFDRISSIGMRLDIPAGTAVRFEPGETRTVTLVEIAGEKIVYGGNNLIDGPVTATTATTVAKRISDSGFSHEPA